jgi:hypothetical protein
MREAAKGGDIINPAIKYFNYVIPACPVSFSVFNVLRCPIPDKRG